MNEELSVGIEGRILRAGTWSVLAGNVTRKVAVLLFAIMLLGTVPDRRRDGRAGGLYVDMRCARCGLHRREHVRGKDPIGNRSCGAFTGRGR